MVRNKNQHKSVKMQKSNQRDTRPSRDGDQFHYLWAARRCLELISPSSDLVAVSVEGSSRNEMPLSNKVLSGENVVDIAEYYGSEELTKARAVVYSQLKHSTQSPNLPWAPGDLERTLKGFAEKFENLRDEFGADFVMSKVKFKFTTNRPISKGILQLSTSMQSFTARSTNLTLKKISGCTGLCFEDFKLFWGLLEFEANQSHFLHQKIKLEEEITAFFSTFDELAKQKLIALVTSKATSEGLNNPEIRKVDVFGALGATEEDLFPVPPLFEKLQTTIPRAQESAIVRVIFQSDKPILIHAAGGVGKSIITQRINALMPPHSVCIRYDCFGNGDYWSLSRRRHGHKEAIVQMTNELAANSLCNRLLPTILADKASYFKTFIRRLTTAISQLRLINPESIICIVVDAADNAELAAIGMHDGCSFVRDLVQEQLPIGVKLVLLCRSERRYLLQLPPGITEIELLAFTEEESKSHLRLKFDQATDTQALDFYRLTGGNPRLQSYALAESSSIQELFFALGPKALNVDDAISQNLTTTLNQILIPGSVEENAQIEQLCKCLGILKPPIPLAIISRITGVDQALIKSFAIGFRKHILLVDDCLQIHDEPVETWFRDKFGSTTEEITKFLTKLLPLATSNSYVATCIPLLMVQADKISDLIELTLKAEALPEDKPADKREIEIQRLNFALKASLKAGRFGDAAMLAMKGGEVASGHVRQQTILQHNTDLVGKFYGAETAREIVSRKPFNVEWLGGNYAYSASTLSNIQATQSEARIHLNLAMEWFRSWTRIPVSQRKDQNLTSADIVELALAQLNLHGIESCIKTLSCWNSNDFMFETAKSLASRLIDCSRLSEVEQIAGNSKTDIFVALAVVLELDKVDRKLSAAATKKILLGISKQKNTKYILESNSQSEMLNAVFSILEAAAVHKLEPNMSLCSRTKSFLPKVPPRALYHNYRHSRFSLLRGYSLATRLARRSLNLTDLASPDIKVFLTTGKTNSPPSDVSQFKTDIGALLPWHRLRTKVALMTKSPNITPLLEETKKESNTAFYTSSERQTDTTEEIAQIWAQLIFAYADEVEDEIDKLISWSSTLRRPLFTPTLTGLARISAQHGHSRIAAKFCQIAKARMDAREDSSSQAETLIQCSRALMTTDKAEAAEYFNCALEIVSKFGDEVEERWKAIIDLSDQAAQYKSLRSRELCYRVSRCAETASLYLDHFDSGKFINTIARINAPASIAILSRLRERDFGWTKETLPSMVVNLLCNQDISAASAISFLSFRGRWNYKVLFSKALAQCNNHAERKRLIDLAIPYLIQANVSHYTWTDIAEALAPWNITISDVLPKITPSVPANSQARMGRGSITANKRLWQKLFKSIDLTTANGLALVEKNRRNVPPPFPYDEYIQELISRIGDNQQIEFIGSLVEADIKPTLICDILQNIPTFWKQKLSVTKELRLAALRLCRRFSQNILMTRDIGCIPLSEICDFGGISNKEASLETLKSLSESSDFLSSGRLFTMSSLLVDHLNKESSIIALDFALNLFEKHLSETDGDGVWSSALDNPDETDHALSGYLWAALGATEIGFRWEASHAVCALARLKEFQILDKLIEHCKNLDAAHFTDKKFVFYDLHATLYLFLALRRISTFEQEWLAKHKLFVLEKLTECPPHVLIQSLAAGILQNLISYNPDGFSKEEIDKVKHAHKVRVADAQNNNQSDRNEIDNDPVDEYYFNDDWERYWLNSMTGFSEITLEELKRKSSRIMKSRWSSNFSGKYKDDDRATRDMYRNHKNWHSHGRYPEADDLSFYMSYHSMMILAASIMESLPNLSEQKKEEFDQWLSKHLLTRADGKWLIDRIDKNPVQEQFEQCLENEKSEKQWPFSIMTQNFNDASGIGTDWLTVWGDWSSQRGRFIEEVSIRSAMVDPVSAPSLLRALQTADRCRHFSIPSSAEEREPWTSPYDWEGWINDEHSSLNLDKHDPWTKKIEYPGLTPVDYVVTTLNLQADSEKRFWRKTKEHNEIVISSQTWSDASSDDELGNYGRRFQIDNVELYKILMERGKNLLLSVRIERRVNRSYSEENDEKSEEFRYLEPYCKYFRFNGKGETRTYFECT